MNWLFIAHHAPYFANAALMTFYISSLGIVLSILVGLACAAVELARTPVMRQTARAYVEVSRNKPLLVQLYFLYFES
ncbi:hypothetical protein CRD60_07710 [Bifidobacterium aemilianum]|uniref:ABC transporter permease n=1 Tax=Bifidobacterium aemilianum TaxID=2493120 RepID=A0A366K7N5_9BIFI|nr:ABC transporter permease subunit [Bifidobacterium aemilianum]RBP97262.1 hypothetical protein CRD60_07710 [Bifidobacterium aemilianum]